MVFLHNRLYDVMKKNNIDIDIINLSNLNYFTDEQINYILALNLSGYRLKSIIYLTSLGFFTTIDVKIYYLIIRAIKKAQDEIMCNMICDMLTEGKDIENTLKQISMKKYDRESTKIDDNKVSAKIKNYSIKNNF